MKTYKELLADYRQIEEDIKNIELITSAGIAQSKAHLLPSLFDVMSIRSGYSMGEYVAIFIKGKKVYETDQTANYAKSCKWQAKHGHVNIHLTLKDAKKLVDMLEQRASDVHTLNVLINYHHKTFEETEPHRTKMYERRTAIVSLVRGAQINGEIKKLDIG